MPGNAFGFLKQAQLARWGDMMDFLNQVHGESLKNENQDVLVFFILIFLDARILFVVL